MMKFFEWIATQDPTKWDLDEATIQSVKDYFHYREICDDDKMELFFWRTLNMYRARYKAILRVESIDFDPLVNKYFEGQFQGSNSATGSSSGTTSGNNRNTETLGTTVTTQGSHSDSESGTRTDEKTGLTAGQDVTDRTNVQTLNTTDAGTVTKQTNSTDTETTDRDTVLTLNTVEAGTGTRDVTESETTDRDDTTTVTYNTTDRNSGTITDAGTEGSTTIVDGENTTDSHRAGVSDGSTKEALKAAPMSAVGITNNGTAPSGGGTGDPTGVNRGRLGGLDFTYATSYGQKDSESNDVVHENSFNTDDTTTTVTGTKGNTRTLGDSHAKTGTETSVLDGTTDTDRTVDEDTTSRVTRTGTESTADDVSVSKIGSVSESDSTSLRKTGTVSDDEDATVTHTGSNQETVESEDSRQSSGTTSGTQATTGTNTNNTYFGNETTLQDTKTATSTTTNRYTGRDGLTPQEAMARATDYLMGYSTAFQWLANKLEICFIGIYDL